MFFILRPFHIQLRRRLGLTMEPAIELVGIDKKFGAVHANKNINLTVAKGSIHGIIGENGAGKSTLMSILYGFYHADSGEIRVDGKQVTIKDSQAAIDAGIGMVHQHFMLVENFSVLENVMLGAEGGALLSKGAAATRKELKRLEDEYGLEVNPDAIIEDLPVGLQQRVEILKAMYRGAEILILDEPTGVLTPAEADHLFKILSVLRDQGKTVILITHKLREIMAITDEVSVMRRGEMVADYCAGAGGKALAIAMPMRGTGRVYAMDISARRLAALGPRAARAGVTNVHSIVLTGDNDPRAKRLAGKLDRVLVDAPCSGFGTLRRNPDLKWRHSPHAIVELAQKQRSILGVASRLVKSGGRLVYATCSILRAENEAIAEDFARAHPGFAPVSCDELLAAQRIELQTGPQLRLRPHLHGTDGFFAAAFQRRE